MIKQEDLQVFVLQLKHMSNCHPLEDVGRIIGTQFQVEENLKDDLHVVGKVLSLSLLIAINYTICNNISSTQDMQYYEYLSSYAQPFSTGIDFRRQHLTFMDVRI